jgi:hypothetical protein
VRVGMEASGGTQQPELATSLRTPGDASAKEHCQGSDGAQAGSSVVLDVAERLRIFAVGRVRFARGKLATEHGVN